MPAAPIGLGVELAPQHVAQLRVLAQRLLALVCPRQEAHEVAVRLLVRRFSRHQLTQRLDRRRQFAMGGVETRDFLQQREIHLTQGFAAACRQVRIAVLGQQVAGVVGESRRVGDAVVRAAGSGGGRVERLNVNTEGQAGQGV